MLHFSSLDLASPILDAVTREGYDTPTPIQAQAIPPILAGRDMLGCAQTGTGKTAAFALPILHHLHTAPTDTTRRGPAVARALILSPTRELATQIADSFDTYGRGLGLRTAVIFGGVKQTPQVRRLRAGVDIIVATPGRLMDLMDQGYVDLRGVTHFVLDEADRMLDMGFIQPIRRIGAALPTQRQTLLFSATMPPNISRLADSLLRDPARIAVTPVASAAPKIAQSLYMVDNQHKLALLQKLLDDRTVERALVFTRTKHGADNLSRKLSRSGVAADSIHGNKSQAQRQRALEAFRSGRARVLVATDVAARGLDVDAISHVFNYNLPNEPEAYVHRIGRTGRAGALGIAISFCDREERGFLRAIEQLVGARMTAEGGGDDRRSGGGARVEEGGRTESGVAPRRRQRRNPNANGRPKSATRSRSSHGSGGGAPAGGGSRKPGKGVARPQRSRGGGAGRPSRG